MGLPNIGPLELIIILAIALLIVGPGKLPEMGSAIGRTIKEFRSASSDITDAVKVEAKEPAAPPLQPNTLSSEAAPNTKAAPAAGTVEPAAAPVSAAASGAQATTTEPAAAPAPAASTTTAAADSETKKADPAGQA